MQEQAASFLPTLIACKFIASARVGVAGDFNERVTRARVNTILELDFFFTLYTKREIKMWIFRSATICFD